MTILRPIAAVLLAGGCAVAASAQDLPYSPVVEANGVLYVAGQLGFADGKLTGPTIDGQTRQALQNVEDILGSVGSGLDDVVRCQVFLTDMSQFSTMNATYRTFFPVDPPARTTVGVTALPAADALIEVQGTAVRGHADRLQAAKETQDD